MCRRARRLGDRNDIMQVAEPPVIQLPAASEASVQEPSWLHKGRIPCLDGLRAISIILVLLEHGFLSRGFPELHASLRPVIGRIGSFGVDVFFAISGFLITLLLVREHQRSGSISIKSFYRRRFLRLMPAFVAYALVVFLLTRLGAAHVPNSDWLHVATYTVNFARKPAWEIGHIWSLSIEEQFYLVWPLALMLAGPRRARFLVIAGLAAGPVLRTALGLFFKDWLWVKDTWTPFRVDCIAAGCLLGLLASDPEFRRRVAVTSSNAWKYLSAAALILPLNHVLGMVSAKYGLLLGESVKAACIVAVIWACINHKDTRFGRLLEWKPAVTLGILSYSLYLWQQLFLNPHNGSWIAAWPQNAVLAVGTAALSYRFVEQPFLRIKDRKPRDSAAGRTDSSVVRQSC